MIVILYAVYAYISILLDLTAERGYWRLNLFQQNVNMYITKM